MTCQAYGADLRQAAPRGHVHTWAPPVRASRAWLACLLLLPTLACQAGGTPPDDSPAPDRQERSAAPAGKDESLREEALARTSDTPPSPR